MSTFDHSSVSIFVKVYLLVYMYIPLFSLILINIYCISIIVLYSKLDYFGSYVMRKQMIFKY